MKKAAAVSRPVRRTERMRSPGAPAGSQQRRGVGIVDMMRQMEGEGRRAERAVVQAILADLDRATRSTSRDVASRAGVSEPTVIRLARRLGCSGFPDLKRRLTQDLATARMFVFSANAVTSQDTEALVGQVYEATAQALAYGFAQRDPKALEEAARTLNGASRVFCMGTGGSSANMALEAENRLFRFDIHVTAIIDSYRQRIAAAICSKNDALLIVSTTGRPRALIDAAAIAREGGASVLALTHPASPLAKAASIVLPLQIPDNDRQFEIPNRSRYAQLYVLDCLATLVGARRQSVSGPKLNRLRSSLLQLHGTIDSQPIGD
ncbi:MAG: MurR/RpiR family transcriptional regulator [Rhodospirillales bacterium]|jgi:RpiR family carbohydrate utilization transcriptional regulator|nr:MurR/RpiR family transcriptional regulator [Rhodospirillales bacterium]